MPSTLNIVYYRIFSSNTVPVELADPEARFCARIKSRSDDQGWFHAELAFPDEEIVLELEQFLATEDGIRAELNTWAAWLESVEDNAHCGPLMEHIIRATRVFTLTNLDPESSGDATAIAIPICQFIAEQTEGVYQIDGRGFFSSDGELLVAEDLE